MRSLGLSEPLYRYVVDHSGPEHPVLRELRDATADLKHAGMQIGVDQGRAARSRSASSPATARSPWRSRSRRTGASSRAT